LKVAALSHFDVHGGAARAAYRIHHAVRRKGVDSILWVSDKRSGDWTVKGPGSKLAKAIAKIRGPLAGELEHLLRTKNPVLHSFSVLPSRWSQRLNTSDVDVIHLHWVNSEMISVKDIGSIRKPIIWTLHDMWAFCGAEHYTEDFRWKDGYTRNNRSTDEYGLDLNRWVWQRKQRHWNNPMDIVVPSQWLADCVTTSALMKDWCVNVIPNAIDTDIWKPMDKILARDLLGLPADVPLLLFGAIDGGRAPRKGFDLLIKALNHLQDEVKDLELVVFGQHAPERPKKLGLPQHYTGHLYDDISLRVLYSAVDVMLVPSRQEAFGQTASEALACGIPVVAFDSTGLRDVVKHHTTGYLACPFDVEDLAEGISWVLNDESNYAELSRNAREDAVARFSYPVIAGQYEKIYKQAM